MENRTAIRLIKALVAVSPATELLNEQDRKDVVEYIDTQIIIEEEFADVLRLLQFNTRGQISRVIFGYPRYLSYIHGVE